MQVDVRSLERFNRMAHEGAQQAASHLSGLAGLETFVDVTKIHVTTADGLGGTDDCVGVEIDLGGGLRGRTVFTFAPESAERLTDALVPGGPDESAIREVGNVMAGGFVDGWADYLDTTIDISPPTYVEGDRSELLREPADDDTLVFASQVEAVEENLEFTIYLFPESASLRDAFGHESDGGETVSVDKLAVFDGMTREGATTVSENLTAMTGIETTVEVTTLSFVPVEEMPAGLRDVPYVGVAFELDGPPSGYLLVLFDETSASDVATALVPGGLETDDAGEASDGSRFGGMRRSAIEEIGNVVANSFVDGWANALGATIDISPPEFVHDLGGAIVDPIATTLVQHQNFAFVSDATIRAADRSFKCHVFGLPNEAELREALSNLDEDATAERRTNAGKL